MKNLTPEMIEKAKVAKSADELLEIAKQSGVEMTEDEAATYFAQLNPKSGELDDDDLDSVAGGAICKEYDGNTDIGKTVRITDGTVCSNCGGNMGTLEWNNSMHCVYIKCKCGKKYLYETPAYEVL